MGLIVKEDKENEKIVEIENIFDEDIDADSKDVTLVENLSITDIIVDEKSNESISVTNVDESVEKDLSQDIDNKHQIVSEEITVAASDDLYFPTTESQDPTSITDNMLDKDISKIKSKGNESVQDVDVKLLNPTCNSEIEGSVVIDTLTRSIVEDSDETEGNTTLIVKEDKENEKIVEIENIFDEDIDADSKDVTLIENLSIKDIIVDEKSNESVSVTNVDESIEKDLSQDIDNKHQIVREEIAVAASDDLYFPTTESQDPTTITDNMLDKDISKIKSKGNESVQYVDEKLLNL